MQHHPVTKLFPPMTEEQYAALKESIGRIGLKEAVWTWQDQLIDGVHRERACVELGVPVRVREWDGDGSLVEFVAAMNKDRRHLTEDQRLAVATDLKEAFAREARAQQRESASRAGKASGESRRKNPNASANLRSRSDSKRQERKSSAKAARAMGVKPRRVEAQETIKQKAPDLHEKVKAGEMTHAQARAEIKRREKRKALKEKAEKASGNGQPAIAWEIRQGDCLEHLGKIEAGTVRLAFADPPYNIGIDYGTGKKADLLPREDFLAWCQQWMEAVARTLTDDGSFWVLINDENAAEFKLALEAAGLHLRQWLIWYESFGVNHSNGFNRTHRHLFWMVKDRKRFVFNPDPVNRPSDRQRKYNDSRADPGGKTWDDVWGVEPPIPRLTDTADERLPDFPTQLPLALLRAVVGCASEPGDLVLDPFSSSATTGVAAVETGRRYIGIEKNPHFVELSTLRLKGLSNGNEAGE